MKRTRKGLFNVHHFPGARLHEAEIALSAPFQSFSCADLPVALQIAFVTGDNAHGQDFALLRSVLPLNLNHLGEILQRFEGARLRDIVDEEEGVAFQVGLRPEAAVFFLPSGVGKAEGVSRAIDGAGHGVGVFYSRIVSASNAC